MLCSISDVKSELEILAYLKNGTLVGLLPVPHPIIIRKYQASEATELWFHTYIWGVIYVRYAHMGCHAHAYGVSVCQIHIYAVSLISGACMWGVIYAWYIHVGHY